MSTTPTTGAEPIDLDTISDGNTGWDRAFIADLPGNLPSATYLAPDLSGRAQREIAALLADVDALLARVRELETERDRLRGELETAEYRRSLAAASLTDRAARDRQVAADALELAHRRIKAAIFEGDVATGDEAAELAWSMAHEARAGELEVPTEATPPTGTETDNDR